MPFGLWFVVVNKAQVMYTCMECLYLLGRVGCDRQNPGHNIHGDSIGSTAFWDWLVMVDKAQGQGLNSVRKVSFFSPAQQSRNEAVIHWMWSIVMI